MRTISQREMRNESGQVLREVEEGQSFTVTRRGTPVARIVPYGSDAARSRPARRPAIFSFAELVRASSSSEEILAELRDER
jgi:prevent-host-death family protein